MADSLVMTLRLKATSPTTNAMCSKTRELIGRLSQTKLGSLRRSGGLLPSLLIQNALVALEENERIGTEDMQLSRPRQPRRSRLSRATLDDDFCVPCEQEFPDAFDTDVTDAAVPNEKLVQHYAPFSTSTATASALASPSMATVADDDDVLMSSGVDAFDSEAEQNLLGDDDDDDDTPLNEYDLFMAEYDSVCCSTSNSGSGDMTVRSSSSAKRSYPEDENDALAADDLATATVKCRRTPSMDSPMMVRRAFTSTVILPLVCA